MKTIIARFTELKKNVAGTADSEFDDLDYNKVDAALKTVGISIKDATGQFRNLDEVFLELSEKWNTLDRNTQRYIATTAAGSRQQSRFIAMMENYDRTMQLVETAQDSAGRSSEQFGKYSDTLTYKINKLKNSWEQLRISLLQSNTYKKGVDFANSFVTSVGKMDKGQIAKVALIGVTIGRVILDNFLKTLKSASSDMVNVGNTFASSFAQGFRDAHIKPIPTDMTSAITIKGGITDEAEIQKLSATFDELGIKYNEINNKTIQTAQKYQEQIEKTKKIKDNIRDSATELGKLTIKQESNNEKFERTKLLIQEIDKSILKNNQELEIQAEAYQKVKNELTDAKNLTEEEEFNKKQELDLLEREQKNLKLINEELQYKKSVEEGMLISQQHKNESLAQEIAQKTESYNTSNANLAKEQETLNILRQQTIERKKSNSELLKSITTNLKGAAGSAVTTGVTTTITMLISGESLGSALKTALPMALTSAVPYFLKIIASVAGVVAKAVGLALGGLAIPLTALLTLLTVASVAYKRHADAVEAMEKAEQQHAKQLKENIKSLKEEQKERLNNLKTEQSRQKSLNESVERYRQLDEKYFRTNKEQEEYEELYGNLIEKFPEIIKSQDDNTHHLELLDDQIEKLNNSIQENINNENQNISSVSGQIALEAKNAFETRQKFIDEFSAAINNPNEIAADFGTSKSFYNIIRSFSDEELSSLYPDLSNEQLKHFDKFLEAVGDSKSALEDFVKKLEELNEKTKAEVNSEIQNAEKNYLETVSINGEGLSEEIIDILSKSFSLGTINENPPLKISKVAAWDGKNKGTLTAFKEGNFGEFLTDVDQRNALEEGLKNRGITDPSDFFKSGTNFKSFSDLPEDYRKFLERKGIKDSTDWDTVKDDAEKSLDLIQQYWAEVVAIQTGSLQEFDEKQLGALDKFLNNYSKDLSEIENMTLSKLNFEDLSTELNQLEKDIETEEGLLSKGVFVEGTQLRLQRLLLEKDIVERKKNAATKLEELKKAYGIDTELNVKQGEKISENLNKQNIFGENKSKYAQLLANIYTNYDEDVADTLSSISLENGYVSLMETKDEYIDRIKDSVGSLSEATKIVEDYIIEGVKYLDLKNFSSGTAQTFLDNLDTYAENFQENFDSIKSAQEQLESGKKLTTKQVKALKKAGYNDVVSVYNSGDKKGAAKLMEKALVTGAMKPLTELDSELKIRREQLKEFENLGAGQSAWRNGTVSENLRNKYNLKFQHSIHDTDLIKILKESQEDFNEIANAFGIEEKQRQAIEIAAQSGKSSLEQYRKEMHDYINELDKSRPETWITGLNLIDETLSVNKEKIEDLKKELEDLNKELEKDQEDVDKAKESWDKAKESLDEAYESLSEANQEMEEAVHGTEDFKSSLDGLANYSTRLKDLENAISDIKDELEDVNDVTEASNLFNQLNQSYNRRSATLQAQNRAIDDALNNIKNNLLSNYGNYISFDEFGGAQVDFSYINMDANDEIRKGFEEQYNLWEEYRDKRYENDKALKELEKERKEYREQALDDYISLQEKVVKTLEDKAKEEVDITKEKYDAMADADSKYLDALQDAINKQQELREKEKSFNDLATKEKKLSLMQRDTSGANAKEVQSLEKEITDSREKLLSDSVNSVIKDLQELYNKQKEARDLEIEYLEEVTENAQYFNEWAKNIMNNWSNAEDLTSWFLENNPEVKDMSVEQLEQYMNELDKDYSSYAKYASLLENDMKEDALAIADEIDFLYNNLSDNVYNIGDVTQQVAQAAADESVVAAQKSIDSAYEAIAAAEDEMQKAEEAYNDAVAKANDTQAKILETQQALKNAEDQAVKDHAIAMDEMVKGAKEGTLSVAQTAIGILADWSGKDINDTTSMLDWAKEHGFADKETGEVQLAYYNAMKERGASNLDDYVVRTRSQYDVVGGPANNTFYSTDNKELAEEVLQKLTAAGLKYRIEEVTHRYAKGGLVDYTGPAWVDGTKTNPEAFLSPQDTVRIGQLAEALSQIPFSTNPQSLTNATTNNGDTYIEIHLNVDNISDDYSVDQMVEKMKQAIVESSSQTGNSVILHK